MRTLPRIDDFEFETVTLDIFDTLLLRRIWPEELQFLIVADHWRKDFQYATGHPLTGYELYTYRRDIRRILQTAKKSNKKADATIDYPIVGIVEWFECIIEAIVDRYDLTLDLNKKGKLLQAMIATELRIEQDSLMPNRNLINWLRRLKQSRPQVKIYYLSDMYLRNTDISSLLQHFGIDDLFDGGLTSSEEKRGKWSGKLYSHYLQKGNVCLGTNLHIGDNYHSDVSMAMSFGNEVAHYNPIRNKIYRRLLTRYGYFRLRRVEAKNRKTIHEQYKRHFFSNNTYGKVSLTTKYIGSIFAPPLVSYLMETGWFSKFEKLQMVAVSSEARTFHRILRILSPALSRIAQISYFPEINRKQATLALVGSIFENEDPYAAEAAITRILRNEQGMQTQSDIYAFLFDDSPEQASPDIMLNKLSDGEFGKLVASSLAKHNPRKIEDARAKIDALVKSITGSQVFMMDVGWNGTVQAMLQQYLLSRKSRVAVSGIYLGFRANSRRQLLIRGTSTGWLLQHIGTRPDSEFFVPDIWEFVYTNKSYGVGFQELVQSGLDQGVEYYKRHVHVSPMEFYLATKKDLLRLFAKPEKQEIKLLGALCFDSGFVDVKNPRIVDMTSSRIVIIKNLLLHPMRFVDYLTKPYCWTSGYIRFYRIESTARLLLKFVQFVKQST